MNGDSLCRKRFMVAVVKGRLKTDFQTTFSRFELFSIFNRMIGQVHIEAGAFARVLVGGFFAVEKFAEAWAFDDDTFFRNGSGGGKQLGFFLGGTDDAVEIRHFFFDGGGFLAFGVHGVEIHDVGARLGGEFPHQLYGVAIMKSNAAGDVLNSRLLQGAFETVGKQAGDGGMLLEGLDVQTERGEDEAVASESAGAIPDGRFGRVVDRFGNQLAAAFGAPVLGCTAAKIDADAPLLPRAAQADAPRIGKQVFAAVGQVGQNRKLELPRQTAGVFGGGVGEINGRHGGCGSGSSEKGGLYSELK